MTTNEEYLEALKKVTEFEQDLRNYGTRPCYVHIKEIKGQDPSITVTLNPAVEVFGAIKFCTDLHLGLASRPSTYETQNHE